MTTKVLPRIRGRAGLALAALLLAGCATQKIDWSARVGTYTFDQAVMDFGPPDKQARLADGTTVAEWLTRRARSYFYGGPGYAGYPYWCGPPFPSYVETYPTDYFLRLTFGADGRLKAWKKYIR